MRRREFLLTAAASLAAAPAPDLKARITAALRKNLDALLLPSGDVAPVRGKAADALVAMSFDILYGATGEQKYRRAAITLADRTLAAMRAAPMGIPAIKEKGQDNVMGGGPPALGWYASILGDLYRRTGDRDADLLYIAGVLDRYPWNPKGWWSATVDVRNAKAVIDLEKPSQINKNAAMAMACAVLGDAVRKLDAKLSESLRTKTSTNLQNQIIPEQQADGFWHYGGTGNDPNNKDVLGYFVLAIELLIWLGKFAPPYRTEAFKKCLAKAEQFASTSIAPITDPYHGTPAVRRTTKATPQHYNLAEEPKRGFALGVALVDGRYMEQATKIIDHVLQYFPPTDRGEIGAKCTHDTATILTLL